ncbi:MAG: hypothetical protein R3293_02080 [Candidatus Promineifilaceae bacterium]|nr:hypothetical protein [Candidatus Promineifilaceae bacterium]
MHNSALELIQLIPDLDHLNLLVVRLLDWLVADVNRSDDPVPGFTESRARALLRASDLLDDPTRHSFERLMLQETAVRIALYDLLAESELADNDEVFALASATAASDLGEVRPDVAWQSLSIAAFAWKSGYPLYQLDPASPPGAYSPAGQVLKRAAGFMRQQVQRSATERDKIGKKLAYEVDASAHGVPSLEELAGESQVAPLPPHYRPPIPVKYPEVDSRTIEVDVQENDVPPPITRGEPIVITADDLASSEQTPTRRAPIQITAEQTQSQSASSTRVVTPNAAVATGPSFAESVRKKFARSREAMKVTKLRVKVQEYPEGPGLYGLQVRVTCQGIKSHVAGTTTNEGMFVCELPVPEHSGLTYDVDITWPRDLDGETERKSITLNADRTEFTLPFYRRLKPE